MLRGYLDSVTSSGYVEGWAYDTDAPLNPLTVSIISDDDRELAWGLAHHYREDLAESDCAAGWCAFRVKLSELVSKVRWKALTVADRHSHTRICRRESMPYITSREVPVNTISGLIATDPTIIRSLDQLKSCDNVFSEFIRAEGVDAFVRAAYIYLLGRPADTSGLRSYGNHFRAQNMTPYELLLAMSDSTEYRSRPRQHCAPTMAAFPFRLGC